VYLDNDSWGGTAVPLDKRDVTIGRSAECTICLEHDLLVSKFHAVISSRGSGYALIDVGSSNGTLLNNIPVTGEYPLREGDVVRIGNCEILYSSVLHQTQAHGHGSHGLSVEVSPATSEAGEEVSQAVASQPPIMLPVIGVRAIQCAVLLATGCVRLQAKVNKYIRLSSVSTRAKVSLLKRLRQHTDP
jgi:hypothetical protein